jgi:hypothetical protein
MTVMQAIAAVQAAGTIHAEAGKLTVKIAPVRRSELQPALDVIRRNRDQVLALLSHEFTLKGHAVELWCDSIGRLFIVADDEDAELAMRRYQATRGDIWTGPEIERVAHIADPESRWEIARFKRMLSGTVVGTCP